MEPFNATLVNPSISAVDTAIKSINPVLNTLLSVLLILVGALLIGKLTEAILHWFLNRLGIDKHPRRFGIKAEPSLVLSKTAAVLVYIIGLFLALNQLSVTVIATNIVIVVILCSLFISLIVTIIGTVPNIIAGFRLRHKVRLRDGKRITVGDVSGRIKSMNLLEVMVETKEHELVVLPYSILGKYILKTPKDNEKK